MLTDREKILVAATTQHVLAVVQEDIGKIIATQTKVVEDVRLSITDSTDNKTVILGLTDAITEMIRGVNVMSKSITDLIGQVGKLTPKREPISLEITHADGKKSHVVGG